MNNSILDHTRQIAADLFNLPLEQVTEGSSPATIGSWDSVQQLNLVLALESNFGLEFSPEDMECMHTIGAMAALIDKKVAAQ